MRMAGPDVVLFTVGALLFGGATYGLVKFGDGGASPSGVFTVTWSTSTEDLPVGSVTLPENGDVPVTAEVLALNLTRVVLRVACSDPNPQASAFPLAVTVAVSGPGNATGSGSGACGSAIEVPVEVGVQPGATNAPGPTTREANAYLAERFGTRNGTGTWNATLSTARGGALPVAIGIQAVTAEVSFVLESYVAEIRPLVR